MQEADANKAGFTINKGNKKALANATINRIALPIANPGSAFDCICPLGNEAVRLNTVIAGIAGQNAFSAASKMRFRGDIGKTVPLYITINCGDAELFPFWEAHTPTATDRFRRPVLPQAFYDEVPGIGARRKSRAVALTPAMDIQILRMPMIVPILVIWFAMRFILGAISFDLPADRGRCPLKECSDFPHAQTLC